MKVASYEVPGNRQKYDPIPGETVELRLRGKLGVPNLRLPRIRRPSGTQTFFVCYPAPKAFGAGYYREVPPGQEAYPAS